MAEKEYIEREKAFDAVFGQFCASSDETEVALNAAIEEIRAIPAANVQPVVLCRDCKHEGLLSCPIVVIEKQQMVFINHDPEFFCASGERKNANV